MGASLPKCPEFTPAKCPDNPSYESYSSFVNVNKVPQPWTVLSDEPCKDHPGVPLCLRWEPPSMSSASEGDCNPAVCATPPSAASARRVPGWSSWTARKWDRSCGSDNGIVIPWGRGRGGAKRIRLIATWRVQQGPRRRLAGALRCLTGGWPGAVSGSADLGRTALHPEEALHGPMAHRTALLLWATDVGDALCPVIGGI